MYSINDTVVEKVDVIDSKIMKKNFSHSVIEVVFETRKGDRLFWHLSFPENKITLKSIKNITIEFVVLSVFTPRIYLIDQVKLYG